MTLALTIGAVVLAYVVGSIPTGYLLGLWLRGVDIRQAGSGNIGATNTLRVLGKGLGAAALLGDAGKGLVAVLLIARLSPWVHAPLACGLAAILGHVYSLFLGFRGGKGVATSLGAFLALCPLPTLIGAAAFFGAVALTRMASAGSIAGALGISTAILVMPHPWPLRLVVLLVAALVVFRHRSNVRRILNRTEPRLGRRQ